jgi:hypothetical protein
VGVGGEWGVATAGVCRDARPSDIVHCLLMLSQTLEAHRHDLKAKVFVATTLILFSNVIL